ncbi:CBS domain-containing protein [Gluconacetobacter diazotrophicus]|uniref:CBS domain-containing protein n=1 Tax=Gluconacetobacter diazotrophicus TaxID=33996 RepID=A0A7W4I5U8_GLUDI|nr:CBS domain-containing protein [Gluconacetobacter diazotrophicus]
MRRRRNHVCTTPLRPRRAMNTCPAPSWKRARVMRVRDIMTASVVGVAPTDPLEKAVGLMLEHGISGVPVLGVGGHVVGVLTEGDLLRRSELDTEPGRSWLGDWLRSPGRAASDYVRTHSHRVIDLMSDSPVTIAPDATLREAVDMMLAHRVKRLPVIQDGRMVGILSRADLLRALMRAASGPTETVSDVQIQNEITEEYRRQSKWAGEDFIHVAVQDGVVELTGTILDERLRVAARVAAENTRGVTSVIDHLEVVEPMTDGAMPMRI